MIQDVKDVFSTMLDLDILVEQLDETDEILIQSQIPLESFGGYAKYSMKQPTKATIKINPKFQGCFLYNLENTEIVQKHVILHEFCHLIDFKQGITTNFESNIVNKYAEYFADRLAWSIQGQKNGEQLTIRYINFLFGSEFNKNDFVFDSICKDFHMIDGFITKKIRKKLRGII